MINRHRIPNAGAQTLAFRGRARLLDELSSNTENAPASPAPHKGRNPGSGARTERTIARAWYFDLTVITVHAGRVVYLTRKS